MWRIAEDRAQAIAERLAVACVDGGGAAVVGAAGSFGDHADQIAAVFAARYPITGDDRQAFSCVAVVVDLRQCAGFTIGLRCIAKDLGLIAALALDDADPGLTGRSCEPPFLAFIELAIATTIAGTRHSWVVGDAATTVAGDLAIRV